MTHGELSEFIRRHRYAVVSSVSDGAPQSAVVGISVSEELEIVFDTLNNTRKYRNLIANPRASIALWTGEATLQYEGIAEEVGRATDGDRYREIYFATWPDGRDRLNWPGITHFAIRPKWIRYSDFDARPPQIEELTF